MWVATPKGLELKARSRDPRFLGYGVIEKTELVLGNVGVVSDMRAAQERKSPVVNARKARCQNFESNFIWRRGRRTGTALAKGGAPVGAGSTR